MDIESIFAAEVFNAARNAKIATTHGCPQTEADQIEGALINLWQYDRVSAQAIADKYVELVDGVPRARAFGGDVTPLR